MALRAAAVLLLVVDVSAEKVADFASNLPDQPSRDFAAFTHCEGQQSASTQELPAAMRTLMGTVSANGWKKRKLGKTGTQCQHLWGNVGDKSVVGSTNVGTGNVGDENTDTGKRTQAASQTQSGAAGAAIKAWSKEDKDSFGIQHLLDRNHNATLAPGLVLSQAIAMTVPNGGISVTVKATVLSDGTASNEVLTTTLAVLLDVPVSTISRFEVRPTPYGTVGFHFFVGSGTPTPSAGESKNNVELVLAFAVAGLALVLLLQAVAKLVSRCQTPKAPKNDDVELEQRKASVAA